MKRVHPFQLRMKVDDFREAQTLSFKYAVSLNDLFREMIKFCQNDPNYLQKLEDARKAKPQDKHGHFAYIRKYNPLEVNR